MSNQIKAGTGLILVNSAYVDRDRIVIGTNGNVLQLSKEAALFLDEVVYERIGVVKLVEEEVTAEHDVPITTGYKYSIGNIVCEVLAVADEQALIRCRYKNGDIGPWHSAVPVRDIPKRRAKITHHVKKIVKE